MSRYVDDTEFPETKDRREGGRGVDDGGAGVGEAKGTGEARGWKG